MVLMRFIRGNEWNGVNKAMGYKCMDTAWLRVGNEGGFIITRVK